MSGSCDPRMRADCASELATMRGHIASIAEIQGHQTEILENMDKALRGNGKPGIKERVNRLESKDRLRGRVTWTAAGCAIALVAKAVWETIFGG